MKAIFPSALLLLFFTFQSGKAQETYLVNGETFSLKTEVQGPLTLLWNTIDGEYRYFVKKGNTIEELKNTKEDGKYQEEYKEVLNRQTDDTNLSAEKVNLTLPSLQQYFEEYNRHKNPALPQSKRLGGLSLRLGTFAGIDNAVYTENPQNDIHPIIGLELELVDALKLKRHAMAFQFKQTFESSDHKYSASQFSLNYRFKFVKTPRLDVYVGAKFAALTFSENEVLVGVAESNPPIFITESRSGSDFSAPFTFGIGADYRVGKGYITLAMQDLVGLNVDSNNEFPLNLALGYKLIL